MARLLTPASRPARPLPKKLLLALGGSAVGASIAAALHAPVVSGVLAGLTFLCAAGFALWFEERVYFAAARFSAARRLLALTAAPVVALLGGFSIAAILGALLHAVPAGPALGGALLGAAVVLTSASFGSLVVGILDVVISATVSDFRARVSAAVLSLTAIGMGVAFGLGHFALTAADQVAAHSFEVHDGSKNKLSIDPGDRALTPTEIGELLHDREAVSLALTLFIVLPAALLMIPALMSACAKLSHAVTERLHPLAQGFSALGKGELDVRVEEKGSREFVQLSRGFNEMVDALSTAQRMERAFGVYVGEQLMSRIRAQHGEAALPATLRNATVFFADIRGFTSMSERLAPEQVLGVLNRYFERVVAVIDAHEGYLDKFIGDAVVVVFSGPVEQPDHAERAARCAIALQRTVAEMNAAGAFPEIGELRVGVGVATGPLVAGNVGSARHLEYTVIGDTVNLAARLTSHAPAGEIWVNEANAGALPEAMPRAALEPMKVKGKEKSVQPYRIWPAADVKSANAG